MKTTAPSSENIAIAADEGAGSAPPQDSVQAKVKPFTFKQLYTSRFYLGKGIVLHLLGQREKAIRNFQMVLCMNWRDEKAAFWLDRLDDGSRSLQAVGISGDIAPVPEMTDGNESGHVPSKTK